MFASIFKKLDVLEWRDYVLVLICCMAFCIKVTAEVAPDLAPDAVDDLYNGCAKDALHRFVDSDLLREELNHSRAFQRAWHRSQSPACPHVPSGGVKEHTAALRTYVTSTDTFRNALNNAVHSYGTNTTTYEDHFLFKSLHFLLMDSIRLLHPGTCKTVYAFSDPKFSVQKGSTVRFGRFSLAYSSLDTLKERDIDDEVILGINTCFFADLGENICHDEPVTLLSPTEKFMVENVRTVAEEDVSYHMVLLKHTQLQAMHNCYMFSRSSVGALSPWPVLTLLTSSLFIIR